MVVHVFNLIKQRNSINESLALKYVLILLKVSNKVSILLQLSAMRGRFPHNFLERNYIRFMVIIQHYDTHIKLKAK